MNKSSLILLAASMLLIAMPVGWIRVDTWVLYAYKVSAILPIYIGLQFLFVMRKPLLKFIAGVAVVVYTLIDTGIWVPESFVEVSLSMKVLFLLLASADLAAHRSRKLLYWFMLLFVFVEGSQYLLMNYYNLWVGAYYYLLLKRGVAFLIVVLATLELFRSSPAEADLGVIDAYEE